jgi:hypothetical protein
MTLSGLDVIARSDDFEDRAASFELRAWQWAFLHALDGKAEVRDVAMGGGIDIDLALDFVAECEAAGLVHVVSLTLHEYRQANGIEEPVVAYEHPAEDPAPAESMAAYETTVPDWMMQHNEEPAAPSALAASNGAAHYAEEPEAGHHDEAVAEHHDDAVADQHDDAVAEHHDDAGVEYHDEPVAEHHDDEPVAEHHDEPVAERAPISIEYFGSDPAAFAEPAYAEPAYGSQDHAARAVADLMSLHPPSEAPVEHAAPSASAVSFEIGSSDDVTPEYAAENRGGVPPDGPLAPVLDHFTAPDPVASNGHAASNGNGSSYAWEPLSLVTTVDTTPVEPELEPEPAGDVPDGISIRLSSNSASDVDHAEPEHETPAPEQGSISFSFSPDMEKPAQDHARVGNEAPPAPAPSPVEAPPLRVTVSASAPAPMPAPVQQKVLVSPQNDKGDLVGNLIARALTFRIK